MIEGTKMMAHNWWIGGPALLITSVLLTNRVIPAMFLLLLFGAAYGIISDPSLLDALRAVRIEYRAPTFALSGIFFNDFVLGVAFLAVPQIPLTLGNAVVAITDENNRLFRHRPVTESRIATSTGLMNLLSACVGGVPMCHGAGGMAGHVQFGARTGGALIILGVVLLVTALLFSNSLSTLFRLFPPVILGVILFLTGAQLSLGGTDLSEDTGERFVTVITAALAIWNVGLRSSWVWRPIGCAKRTSCGCEGGSCPRFVDRGVLAVRLPFDQDGQCLGIADATHVRKSL
jgi:hypothetical protein